MFSTRFCQSTLNPKNLHMYLGLQKDVTCSISDSLPFWRCFGDLFLVQLCDSELLLLMEGILHQLIWQISSYLQGFIHPGWCRISSINSIKFYTKKLPPFETPRNCALGVAWWSPEFTLNVGPRKHPKNPAVINTLYQ